MVVSTVWALAEFGELNLKRAGRTVPPDSSNFNHTRPRASTSPREQGLDEGCPWHYQRGVFEAGFAQAHGLGNTSRWVV